MFDKLSFSELAKLYTAVADLEKHYGEKATQEGLKAMADRLDRKEPAKTEVIIDGKKLSNSIFQVSHLDNNFNPVEVVRKAMKESVALKQPLPGETVRVVDETTGIDTEATVGPRSTETQLELLPKPRHKVKQTRQRVHAQRVAEKIYGMDVDNFLAHRYFRLKEKQSRIAERLNCEQTTISNWIKLIPEEIVKRWSK